MKKLSIALILTFLLTSAIWPADAKTHRSAYQRNLFLYQHGYCSSVNKCHTPKGMEVHHIIPLAAGGKDLPENMVLLTKEQHEIITSGERKFYGWK